MKKFNQLIIILGFLLSSAPVTYAQLSGDYTVGDGGDYATISAAIAAINADGLSGDVTLTIKAGTYNEQVNISNLNNGDFNVTLEGEDLENTSISPPYEDVLVFTGINIEDTDNITIRNLTIDMPMESGGSQIAIYVHDASNISIEGNMISSISGISIEDATNIEVLSNIVDAERVAIGARSCNTLDVIHNTLHSDQVGFRNNKASGDFTVFTEAVLVFDGVLQNVNVINNIFSGVVSEDDDGNAGISFGVDGSFTSSLAISNLTSDFNLFDADLSMAITGAGLPTTVDGVSLQGDLSLADWNVIEYDLHSTSFSPDFIENTNFRARNEDFRFGTYLSEFATDIDGETRIEDAVDVGADQYCISIENTESVTECHAYEFAGSTLTESGEYFGKFVAVNGCDSLVTLNLTILGPSMGSANVTAEGSYIWNDVLYSESGSYEQTLTDQSGCDSIATLNLTIEPYFLQGNFVIGSSTQADFPNFTEAIADLQYATLTGDVEYTVEAGTYSETLKISEINSNDYNISFIGEEKSTTILHPLDKIEGVGAGVFIDGTDKVMLQNLTLEMDDISDIKVSRSSNDTKGISIVNSDDVTLDNITLKNGSEIIDVNASEYLVATGIYADGVNRMTIENSSFSGAGAHITMADYDEIDILSNTFQRAREVIRNADVGSNLSIEHNDFTGPFRVAIDLSEVVDLSIKENNMNGVDVEESSFTMLLVETTRAIIQGNFIENVEYGIALDKDQDATIAQNRIVSLADEALEAKETDNLTVVNNFFGDVVELEWQLSLDFIHNTVVAQSSDERYEVVFFRVDDLANEDLTVRISNNILVGGNQLEDHLMSITTVNDKEDFSLDLTVDHNLYYLDDQAGQIPLITYEDNDGTTQYSTLAEWQGAQPYDQNSQSFAPSFAGATDFHITNATDYRFGAVLDDVSADIDGDGRLAAVGYDVGADQFCETEENEISVEACGVYSFGGNNLRSSGAYQATFKNQIGCDSLVTLNLTILPTYTERTEVETCDPYEFDGQLLDESGRYFSTFQSVLGCDSLVILDLTILQPTSSMAEISSCESYDWNGMTFTASGTYQELLTNAAGCDSTATLRLTILEPTDGSEEVSACSSYLWEGEELTTSGLYERTLVNAVGCDSLATLDLTILEPTSSFEEVTHCGSYEWGGALYTESGNYEQLLTNAAGCDSTAILDLTVLVSDQVELEEESCGAYDFGDLTLTATGDYQQVFTNQAGCDSIVDLSFTYYAEPVMDIIISDATVAVPDQAGFSYQWINCETGEAITGETSNAFTPEESGTYAVEVSNGLCSETSICVERVIVLSASTALLSEISIFPNPTSDFLKIDLNRIRQEVGVELLTLDGKKVLEQRFYNQDQLTLDVKGRQGIHLLRLDIDAEGHVFQKVLIK